MIHDRFELSLTAWELTTIFIAANAPVAKSIAKMSESLSSVF